MTCECGYCKNNYGTFEEQEARRVKSHKESMEIIKRMCERERLKRKEVQK